MFNQELKIVALNWLPTVNGLCFETFSAFGGFSITEPGIVSSLCLLLKRDMNLRRAFTSSLGGRAADWFSMAASSTFCPSVAASDVSNRRMNRIGADMTLSIS